MDAGPGYQVTPYRGAHTGGYTGYRYTPVRSDIRPLSIVYDRIVKASVCSQHFLFQSHEVRLALQREGCVEYLSSEQAVSAVTPSVLRSSGYRPDTPQGLEVRVRGDSAPLVSWQRVMCASSYELWYGSLDQEEKDSG